MVPDGRPTFHLPAVADAFASAIEKFETGLRLEQAPHGIDEWDERRLQHALAAALREENEVALEVHYPSTAGAKLSHRPRCDLVLTPRGRPLHRDETLPLGLCPPESALWIELKIACQYRAGGAPHPGYGSKWRRLLVTDLRKMAADPLIRDAALVLIAFTENAAVLDRDLALFEDILAEGGLIAGFRHTRTIALVDRIGHRVCGVALWPTVQR